VGKGLDTSIKHLSQTIAGENGLAATIKCLRGAAEIGLGTTAKYRAKCLCVLK
jgi:hypothetical protein